MKRLMKKLNHNCAIISKLHAQICIRSYCASRTNVFGTVLGLLLVRSSFLVAGSSFWSMRSRTVLYPLVAQLVAVLLNCMKLNNSELFRSWPKWHSVVTRQIGMKLSEFAGLVGTKHVRSKHSVLESLVKITVACWVFFKSTTSISSYSLH